MGAGAFHGRVRDGIGCRHSALEPPDRRKADVSNQGSGIRDQRSERGAALMPYAILIPDY